LALTTTPEDDEASEPSPPSTGSLPLLAGGRLRFPYGTIANSPIGTGSVLEPTTDATLGAELTLGLAIGVAFATGSFANTG